MMFLLLFPTDLSVYSKAFNVIILPVMDKRRISIVK